MARRLRLLWVTPSLPRRGQSAFQERTWALLQALTPQHDVTLLAFERAADGEVAAKELPEGLTALHRVTVAPQWEHDPLSLLPPTVRAGVADPRCRRAVAEQLAEQRFDVAQFELIELAHVMPVPEVPTLLSVHQLGSAQVYPQWQASGGFLRERPAAWFRHARDREFERRALHRPHRIIALSPEDGGRIHALAPGVPLSIVPMGVDATAFAPQASGGPRCDLLFVGHFAHPPNVDAVQFLCRDLLPRLGRPVRLRIVGHAAPQTVRSLARPGAVEVVGSVPDVRDELAGARVVVAPVRFGTGMRGKVLEALAAARPVVTTPLGAEGLGASDGSQLFLADDVPAWIQAITRLLADETLATRVGAAGRALALERFDWPRVAAAQLAAYAAVLDDPPPRSEPQIDRVSGLARWIAGLGYGPAVLAGAAVVARRHLRRRE